MDNYEQLREAKIKEKGLDWVRKGEAEEERQSSQPLVSIRDAITGQLQTFPDEVADKFLSRKTHERPRLLFTVPYLPWKTGE